jgi:hypothetical protein
MPAVNSAARVRAVADSKPIQPEGVERYLATRFGDALAEVQEAMTDLAGALRPQELASRAFGLYEQFRPSIQGEFAVGARKASWIWASSEGWANCLGVG